MTNNVKDKPLVVTMDDDKNTKLHYACSSRDENEILKYIKEEPNTLDFENYLGWTPLMMACRKGNLKAVNILIENGANVTKKNKFGMSVFLLSIAGKNLEVVNLIARCLLSGGVSKQSMQNLVSPLSLSILFDCMEIVQYLLEQKFQVNSCTPFTGITPLMFASAMENQTAYNLLLSHGADARFKSLIGVTAQDIAQQRKSVESTPSEPYENQPQIFQKPVSNMHLGYVQPNISHVVISPAHGYFGYVPSPFPNIATPSPNHMVDFMGKPHVQQVFFPQEFSPGHLYAVTGQMPCYHSPNYHQQI